MLTDVALTTSTGESPFFLVYKEHPTLPIHQILKTTESYKGDKDIDKRIEQSHIALSIAAKMLARKCADQKKSINHRPSEHDFKVGDLVLVKKHNKTKLELKWEVVGNQLTGRSKHCNVTDLKLKDPAEDCELKADSIEHAAKFVNQPDNLLDIDLLPESDNEIDKEPEIDTDKLQDKHQNAHSNGKGYNLRQSIKDPAKLNL